MKTVLLMMSNPSYHYNEYGKHIFILCKPKRGKREASLSSEVKDPVVNAGTLIELEHNSSGDAFIFRTLDSSGRSSIKLSCKYEDEFKFIDYNILLLLLPINSPKERLHVFNDKELLTDGQRLQVSTRIFVRVKDVHLPSEVEGIIQYKGPVDESKGTYFGVQLKEGRGNSDGSLNGHQYFHSYPNMAVFVPLHKIRKSREDWQKYDRLRASELPSNNGSLRADNRNHRSEDDLDLKIGDRIVWPVDNGLYEKGTVCWIGVLPDEAMGGQTIGVDFDNQVGSGTGKYKDQRLFYTQPGHASLIPPMGLIKERDFLKSMGTPSPYTMNSPIASDQMHLMQKNKSLTQPYGPSFHQVKAENKSSLPAQFNHHTGYLEPVGATNGMNPVMYEQSQRRSSGMANRVPDPTLLVGTNVEVQVQAKTTFYGVIRWIGFNDVNFTKLTAGLELEQEIPGGTDGVFKGRRYFHCSPGRALFVPLTRCVKDRRYAEENGGVLSPDVTGDIPIPEICTNHELRLVCGKNRGIQGHHNSCYLDSTLFCMFYFSNVFDSIFNRPPKENDLPQYPEVQTVLKDGIVNPLRKNNFVSSQKVWKLRVLLDKLGTVPGMMGEEKDVEEFLSALLSQIMKADPLLHLSTGEHTYFYQLFMEKDDNLLLPTTQKLVELSFLQGNVKLKEVPACLMIQMPRFGKDYKMFRRIVPSLELDITDILENSPRDCIVCGDLATWECKKCYQIHGQGLNTTAFCDKCKITSHKNVARKNHTPEKISTARYFPHFQQKKEEERERSGRDNGYDQLDVIVPLPREKMELFAVICIQTSHYVSFVKCGPGINAPWVFFDSMADRIGEQEGYNVPEVVHIPELATWLSENQLALMNKDDKDLPEHLRRILCDGYMCMYQSPDVMMFQ